MSTSSRSTATYSLLTDGSTIEIRQASTVDEPAVRKLFDELTPQSRYMRFMGSAPAAVSGQSAERICRPAGPDHGAVIAVLAGEVVGVAEYERVGGEAGAEFATAVADRLHHRGVGTLLLEQLVVLARDNGVRAFEAMMLTTNHPMLQVFADLGLRIERAVDGGVSTVTIWLDESEHYLDAQARRESAADAMSLRPLFRPEVVAVVGAGRSRTSIGHAVLSNIHQGGFPGTLYAVNPHAHEIDGVPCYPSVSALPETPDLAIVAVPAAAVVAVADECGRRGVRALVVVTSGLGPQGAELHAACRRHGMRLVGPNGLGIVSALAGSGRLNATFAAGTPVLGNAGLVAQSGGVGIALLEHLGRLGIGVSTFASVGDKYDVSANDMLQWWEHDGRTELGLLYVESFGNPRKFARTARRVARQLPLLTVKAGTSEAGRRAAASHTAAAATPAASRDALFHQAGIIATESLAELIDTAALLALQPVPAGDRIAIMSNAGGIGVIAADACVAAGLTVPTLTEAESAELAELLPDGAACANPVDTTAAASAEQFHRCLERLAGFDGVSAVLTLIAPTALGELTPALTGAAGQFPVPVVVVRIDQPATVEALTCADGMKLPCYADPRSAARALAHAVRYQRWTTRPPGVVAEPPKLDRATAAQVVRDYLAGRPDGGWLPPDQCARLLDAYRIPAARLLLAVDEAEAVAAAAIIGGSVAMKAYWPELVHKSDAGAIRLNVTGPDQVRAAFQGFRQQFGEQLAGVVVQEMAKPGVEILIGTVQDPVFGPLVAFGAGGVDTDLVADRVVRLTPLTDRDAEELVDSARISALLRAHRGRPPADRAALLDLINRVSRLADDVPELAELDLNPVMVRPGGVTAADVRVRLAPQRRRHPYQRALR
ncbi:MAG TPA: GNAT family N-acetyltransferase [Actinomycetes bacterium]|nr:GNAT family N-acetyltransferase [Actinomycetes bacterium]